MTTLEDLFGAGVGTVDLDVKTGRVVTYTVEEAMRMMGADNEEAIAESLAEEIRHELRKHNGQK